MKKLLFFLLLMTAVVGRAQTSLDLLCSTDDSRHQEQKE